MYCSRSSRIRKRTNERRCIYVFACTCLRIIPSGYTYSFVRGPSFRVFPSLSRFQIIIVATINGERKTVVGADGTDLSLTGPDHCQRGWAILRGWARCLTSDSCAALVAVYASVLVCAVREVPPSTLSGEELSESLRTKLESRCVFCNWTVSG
jgi:hypothetical protein